MKTAPHPRASTPSGGTAAEVSRERALELLFVEGPDLMDLLAAANRVREDHKGRAVKLCSIVNAKSGRCPEDCSFCSQSVRYSTQAPDYPLLSADEILARALRMKEMGAREYSIVTSGYGPTAGELGTIREALRLIKERTGMETCASLGILPTEELRRLKEAGLDNYHHNIETAPSHHASIVTTHTYADEVEAVRRAQGVGLKVCCGGIFGMGESPAQRVEMLLALRSLGVDHIPINFLNPIPGTPMEGRRDLTPLDCLKVIAVARLLMPDTDLFICGGREVNLRGLQSLIFFAGANGIMTGGYLTTQGRPTEEDRRMIADLGLTIFPP